MEKTPRYIMMMVGMVALVAIVYMLTRPGIANCDGTTPTGASISGNVVVSDIAPVDLSIIGKVLLGIVLVGTAVVMYRDR
jgi:hypothetical protein